MSRLSDLGFSEPFMLAPPTGRDAASCLVCGALVILPRNYDAEPVEAIRHHNWHKPNRGERVVVELDGGDILRAIAKHKKRRGIR